MDDGTLTSVARALWWEREGGGRIPIRGTSMEPLLQAGDEIEVRRVEAGEIRFGDVVVFVRKDAWVAHRVIGRRRRRGQVHFLEKGDRAFPPTLLPASAIEGKVIRVVRDGRTIELQTPRGRWVGRLTAAAGRVSAALQRIAGGRRPPAWLAGSALRMRARLAACLSRGPSSS